MKRKINKKLILDILCIIPVLLVVIVLIYTSPPIVIAILSFYILLLSLFGIFFWLKIVVISENLPGWR